MSDVVGRGRLLVSGACLRPGGHALGEGRHYDRARLIELDLETGESRVLINKDIGGENYPDEHPNIQFTACCIHDDILWLPTDTEVLGYKLPSLELIRSYSHTCFHNIHSVHVFNGDLVVTSTGLDLVILLDINDGRVKQILNAEGKDPWHRFDAATDYRKIHSTRPHDCHPNFIFSIDDSLWVTRCTQEDAISLDNPDDRIDISGIDSISVHDGVWWGKKLIFTRVDGKLAVCDPPQRKIIETLDPFRFERNRPRGWCRGLFIDKAGLYLGYSRLRQTNVKSKLKYLSQGNFRFGSGNSALIVKLRADDLTVERIYETPEGMIDAIYGITLYS